MSSSSQTVESQAENAVHSSRLMLNGNCGSYNTDPLRAQNDPSNIVTEQSSANSSQPSPQEFDRAGAFIQNLLGLKGQDIFYSLYFDSYKSEVWICNDGDVKYTLCRSYDPLDHNLGLANDQNDDHFRQLVHTLKCGNEKVGTQKVPYHCYEDLGRYHASFQEQGPAKIAPAKFVPLGWLEKSVSQAGRDVYSEKHTTNYVLLWNTSTKPQSLWVCYDYYTPDIHGRYTRSKLGQPTYYNASEDFVFGPQASAFPLEKNTGLGEDETDGVNEQDSDGDQDSDSGSMAPLMSQVPNIPPSPVINTPCGGDQARNPGFFDTESPFDLAVLAIDIKQWDADTGLDPASMHDCLRKLRFRLGNSLRARAWASLQV